MKLQICSFELQRVERGKADHLISSIQHWSFSIVFDMHSGIFFPVYKRHHKGHECQMCRADITRRGNCKHDSCCIKTARRRNERGTRNTEPSVFLLTFFILELPRNRG